MVCSCLKGFVECLVESENCSNIHHNISLCEKTLSEEQVKSQTWTRLSFQEKRTNVIRSYLHPLFPSFYHNLQEISIIILIFTIKMISICLFAQTIIWSWHKGRMRVSYSALQEANWWSNSGTMSIIVGYLLVKSCSILIATIQCLDNTKPRLTSLC